MKLEIGPGERKLGPDWTCVGDFSRPGVVDYICNWGEDKLPFEDGSFEVVYSSHALEHVPWYSVDQAISECFRVLTSGGKIEIHVPNFEYIVKCYLNNKIGDNWVKANNRENPLVWAASRVFSYGPSLSNYHKSAFDKDYLFYLLTKYGFSNIKLLTHVPRPRGLTMSSSTTSNHRI